MLNTILCAKLYGLARTQGSYGRDQRDDGDLQPEPPARTVCALGLEGQGDDLRPAAPTDE
jgi:hypothetical protein